MPRITATAVLTLALAVVSPLAGQTPSAVRGRVVTGDGVTGVPQATVELVGVGVRLSDADGGFRFERVDPGSYLLRIAALGYASNARRLEVSGETTVTVRLEIAPLALDSLPVEIRLVDVDGLVVDRTRAREVVVVDAEVLSNRAESTQTDSHGRFALEDVPEAAPLRIEVRAFGYLPVDTVVAPTEDAEYVFELEPDELAQQMINLQVRRLEQRAAGLRGIMAPIDRDVLLRHAGAATMLDVLIFEYPHYLGRIVCGLIDERNIYSGGEARTMLAQMLPEEVERIEFLAAEPNAYEGHLPVFQLRLYTRAFIQDMIARQEELRTPIFNTTVRPAICQ